MKLRIEPVGNHRLYPEGSRKQWEDLTQTRAGMH